MEQITIKGLSALIIGIIFSYLLGSIPFAYIIGRFFRRIDIRQFGSGNIGATNAFRVLGKGAGILVLLLDMFKGFFSVTFISNYVLRQNPPLSEELLRIILGIACIIGHNWTIFLRFRGGKGVATSLGVLVGLGIVMPELKIIFSLVILIWLFIFFIWRMVSLASILSSLSLPIFALLFRQSKELIIMSLVLFVFIILRHKANIKRILIGKESRIKFKKST